MTEAVAYMRTSSATNVGADKDSEVRQRAAIEAFAAAAGYVIAETDWFYDAAVKGADAVDARPGFANMLARIAGNGVRTIIVETANRFARDLMVQEVGYKMLKKQGITLIAADSPQAFVDDTPTAVMLRQILGAVAQFEKASLVAKLKVASDRKKALTGKCGGRKSYAELRPEVVAKARELRPGRSLRVVAAELAASGYTTPSGRPYAAMAVRSMLNRSAQQG